MGNLRRALAKYATDLVMLAGGALIAVGAGMIYLPAGLIAAGLLAVAGAVLNSLGGGGSE